MMSTRKSSSTLATRNFSSRFIEQPGDCSPSRRVVSKIKTRFASEVVIVPFPSEHDAGKFASALAPPALRSARAITVGGGLPSSCLATIRKEVCKPQCAHLCVSQPCRRHRRGPQGRAAIRSGRHVRFPPPAHRPTGPAVMPKVRDTSKAEQASGRRIAIDR